MAGTEEFGGAIFLRKKWGVGTLASHLGTDFTGRVWTGVDPSSRGHVVTFLPEGLPPLSFTVLNTVFAYLNFITLLKSVPRSGFYPAVMEDQFLRRGPKMNPKTHAVLVRARSRLELAFEMSGVDVVMTEPSKWQSPMLRCPPKTKSEARKWAAVNLTRQLTGHKGKLSYDEADSFCMALYGMHHQTL